MLKIMEQVKKFYITQEPSANTHEPNAISYEPIAIPHHPVCENV